MNAWIYICVGIWLIVSILFVYSLCRMAHVVDETDGKLWHE